MKETYKSRVYTDRPDYADFDAPAAAAVRSATRPWPTWRRFAPTSEPNVVKAAWNIFGKSYEYRAKYEAYKKRRREAM